LFVFTGVYSTLGREPLASAEAEAGVGFLSIQSEVAVERSFKGREISG
jgi:hypothetical protein